MKVNGCSLVIPEGKEDRQGYVSLPHTTQYSIEMESNFGTQCDAELSIDGKEIGTFRLQAYGKVVLERGLNDRGRFTFYRADSREAIAADLGQVNRQNLGLIQVKFIPAKKKISTKRYFSGVTGQSLDETKFCYAINSLNAGGTGLSGHSKQDFETVQDIDRDENSAVIISLRLVENNNEPRALVGLSRSNPIPKPV